MVALITGTGQHKCLAFARALFRAATPSERIDVAGVAFICGVSPTAWPQSFLCKELRKGWGLTYLPARVQAMRYFREGR